MSCYFSKLNDTEFETTGASVVGKIWNKKVEILIAVIDGGVNGSFWVGKKKEGIIQCRHYMKTPYRTLISKVSNGESPRAIRKENT